MYEEQEGVQIMNPDVEDIELSDAEDVVENETQESENTDAEEIVTDKEENPLMSALNAERKERKRLEKELKKVQKANTTTSKTYDILVDQGIDKELAKTLSEAIDKPNTEIADIRFNNELLKISKKEDFADIETYSEEVRSLFDKGLTIEQAYYAVTGGKKNEVNTKSEIKRELEAKMKNQQEKANILDIDTKGSASASIQNKIKYTQAELAMAKAAGMTIEEYKAIQTMSSTQQYDKYKQSKKKE